MKIIALTLTVMIFSISCAVQRVKPSESRPLEVKAHSCNMCHLPHKREGKILLNKPLSELCVSCHSERKGSGEHIVGVKPSMPAEELPLDTEGKMTCITCHDPHGSKSLLRAPSFSELCKKCHRRY